MNWYIDVIRKYAVFSGRSRRKEYWMFFLFNMIFSIVIGVVDGIVGTFSVEIGMGLLGTIYALALLIPGIAVTIRRLHDTNRSGWWMLIGLVPLVGAIVLLVFLVQESEQGTNQYGDNPQLAAA